MENKWCENVFPFVISGIDWQKRWLSFKYSVQSLFIYSENVSVLTFGEKQNRNVLHHDKMNKTLTLKVSKVTECLRF